jgi:hypothetical protein
MVRGLVGIFAILFLWVDPTSSFSDVYTQLLSRSAQSRGRASICTHQRSALYRVVEDNCRGVVDCAEWRACRQRCSVARRFGASVTCMGAASSDGRAFQRGACDVEVSSALPKTRANEIPTTLRPGKKLLIILIGFLGCTPGIIAKYSQMYGSAGVETVEILPSIGSMLLAHQGWRGKGSKSVRNACDIIIQHARNSEVVIHLFSNNGFIFFGSCMLAQPRVASLVSAVILDSAPCYITPRVAATGLVAALHRLNATVAGTTRRARVVNAVVSPLLWTLDSRQRSVWEVWASHFPPVPHLFLYSGADGVIPANEIEVFATEHQARLRLQGVEGRLSRWEGPGHCELMRADPAKYSEHVLSFLSGL